jgi:hypothetical protein
MSAFLNDPALINISLNQVTVLVRLLHEYNYREKEFIEQRYQEQSIHFAETLKFLTDIGWIAETANDLALAQPITESKIAAHLIQTLIQQPNPYRQILSDYLVQYVVSEEGIVYRSHGKRHLNESSTRNFLIELDVVSYEVDSEWYRLNSKYAGLYLWAKNNQNTASQEAFDANDEKKKTLGTAAELAVLDFERSRVPTWQNHIDHVSARQPYACYDIISVTVTGDSVEPRYIEVKAVSAASFRFFWTRSEMEAAKLLGETYYLYLLPVLEKGVFSIDKLRIVQNPCKNILNDPLSWAIQNELITCCLM